MLAEQLTLVSLAVEPTSAIQEPVAPVSTRSAFWNTVLLLSELQCHTPPTRSPPSRNVELLPVTIANDVTIANNVTIAKGVTIATDVTRANDVTIAKGVTIPFSVTIAEWVTIAAD